MDRKVEILDIVPNKEKYLILIGKNDLYNEPIKIGRGVLKFVDKDISIEIKKFKKYKLHNENSLILETRSDLSSIANYPFRERQVLMELHIKNK